MADQTEPLLYADEISAALRAEPRKFTPNCLEPDALIQLIERGGRSRRARRMLAHLAHCSYCRHEYDAMRQTLQRADTVRQALADRTPPNRSSTLRRRWLVPALSFGGALAAIAIIVGLARTAASLRSQNTALQTQADTLLARLKIAQQDLSQQSHTEVVLQETQADNAKLQNQLDNLKQKLAGVAADRQPTGTQLAALKQTEDAILKGQRPAMLDNLTEPVRHLMGSDEGEHVVPLSPVGTVVESNRPTFRWQTASQARNYVVHIKDNNTENEVIKSKPLEASKGATIMEWTPPPSQMLQRSDNHDPRIYRWYVTFEHDDGTEGEPGSVSPRARFRVMELERLKALTAAKHRFAGSHLSLGLLYVQAGLLDEAEEEFKALQKADPAWASAQQLLARVRGLHTLGKSL